MTSKSWRMSERFGWRQSSVRDSDVASKVTEEGNTKVHSLRFCCRVLLPCYSRGKRVLPLHSFSFGAGVRPRLPMRVKLLFTQCSAFFYVRKCKTDSGVNR